MSNRLSSRPKRYVKHRAQKFGKRMARRRRIQRRSIPLRKRVSRLARQVGRLSAPTKTFQLFGGPNFEYLLGERSGVQRWDTFTTAIGINNVVVARLSGIVQGDNENERIGDEIFIQRLQWDIKLMWVGVGEALTGEAGDRFYMPLNETVRIMVVRETDSVSPTAAWQQPPSIPDMIQGFSDAVGSAGFFDPATNYHALHGTYKSVHEPGHPGSAAIDRLSVRQRDFEVLYDKTVKLTWKGEWGSVPLNTAETADDLENIVAKSMMINVNLPINRKMEFLQAATQAVSEVRGNIYLYIFSSGTNMTGANWPTSGGTVGTPSLSVAARFRARYFYRDV